MAKEIYFVTTNPLKAKMTKSTLAKYGIKVIQKNTKLPEIQSLSGQEVCEYTAKYAREVLNKPVVITDVSYSILALNGFPGPFVKFINKWLSAQNILKMMEEKTNRKMIITEYLSYCDEKKLKTFKTEISCRIAQKILNNRKGTTFDKITIREGTDIPQNMLDRNTLERLFRKKMENWESFGRWFLKRFEKAKN